MSSFGGRYTHHERITLSPLAPESGKSPTSDGGSDSASVSTKLDVDVTIEATSSVNLPNGFESVEDIPATPFPPHILDLVRAHELKRLLVQVGSSSTSSWSSTSQLLPTPNAIGPVGTSIIADFYISNATTTSTTDDTGADIDSRIKSLLRSLVGSRLICAPLDSISIHKNQHQSYPLQKSTVQDGIVVTYQVILPASSGHFCLEGLHSFRQNLLPCRNHAGFLATSPSADIMLGMASGSRRGSRRGLWIEVATNGNGCRDGGDDKDECTLSLHQGVSYGIQVGAKVRRDDDGVSGAAAVVRYAASVSLGDVLGDASASLNHCPLADTSRIITNLPTSSRGVNFLYQFQGDNDVPKKDDMGRYEYELNTNNDGNDVDERGATVFHDVHSLAEENGPMSLSEEWVTLETEPVSTNSYLSVDRTIDMPKGVANHGIFRTVYRNERRNASPAKVGIDDLATVVIETLDTYPKFIKPLLQSLSVRLYQGYGAGSAEFVPSMGAVSTSVLHETISVKDLARERAFELTPNIDGSVSLRVTTAIPPDSSLWISLQYTPRFSSFEHYPSDPNRGVDILPSYGSFHSFRNSSAYMVCPSGDSSNNTTTDCFSEGEDAVSFRLYTSSAIAMPPVPDMSMPFNVISLTCTLYAFVIGSMVNFLVRKSSQSISDAYKGKKEESKMAKIKGKIKKKLQVIGLVGKKEEDTTST